MSIRALQEVLEGVPAELQHPEINSGITRRAAGDLRVPQRGDPCAIKAADGGAGGHLGTGLSTAPWGQGLRWESMKCSRNGGQPGPEAANSNQLLYRGRIEIHLQLSRGSAAAFPPGPALQRGRAIACHAVRPGWGCTHGQEETQW